MNRRLALLIGVGTLVWARASFAQDVTIGYQGLPYKATGENQNGIQVSDGVLMHVGAGAEAGYDTNVFYQNSADAVGSGIVRTTGFVDVSNSTRTGLVPSGLAFDARASLQYRYYTTDDSRVQSNGYQSALLPTAGLTLGSTLSSTLGFGLADSFGRIEEPPYNPGNLEIKRDTNLASAELRWSPGGGRLVGTLRYTNIVDVFEDRDLSYANSLTQQLMLDASWKWLPKTAFFVQLRQGYVTYLNANQAEAAKKFSSYPLYALTGLRGLITERTSILLTLGYQNAFYTSNSATTTGFLGSTYLEAQVTLRPTLTSRIVAGYLHNFENSVISAFYYNESLYASYVQQLGGRFAFDVSGRYTHRDYQGFYAISPTMPVLATRVDNNFVVGATLDYFMRNWAFLGVGYALYTNAASGDFSSVMGAGTFASSVDYVKQQVFARVGISY
jgi:hypothetical protein